MLMLEELTLKDKDEFLSLLSTFREVDEQSIVKFRWFLDGIKGNKKIFVYRIDKIIGTVSLLYDQKFINNGALYVHIEDVVILPEYRGKGIGKLIIDEALKICKQDGAYKALLHCEPTLSSFYAKTGFEINGINMELKLE